MSSTIMARLHELAAQPLDDAGNRLSVADACTMLGVSARVLHRICFEHTGIGPKRFMTVRRLHMARRAAHASSTRAGVNVGHRDRDRARVF